ncbi:hypothetical protein BDY19DRAFT_880787 [Irpex rosettiformis]|uniref:Uncharacterized protein n=1 Tax=Irpex rosettiformis TaxID=378272 RepID=A0ACB8UJ20_9APHY|nr:hypothetical protein BDY19DRAFT_880787 [Irpex rosettiformis]
MSTSAASTLPHPSLDRLAELQENLSEIRARVQAAAPQNQPKLIAVSKIKPASDVYACYLNGQRDFGENYVQELEEKAELLSDIKWHFIGTLQSNKAKNLALTPNIYAIQTLTSAKTATALNKHLLPSRATPLNVFIQVNTSGEDVKSGLGPLTSAPTPDSPSELLELVRHVISSCPRLRLQGLMTIGSLSESLSSKEKENEDFERLRTTRDILQEVLRKEFPLQQTVEGGTTGSERWGEGGKLLLSMGMSSDFEAALHAGSDAVRVGTSIFGARPKKGQAVVAS